MNYMEQVAQMLGVELEEEFKVTGNNGDSLLIIKEDGIYRLFKFKWVKTNYFLDSLLTGKIEITKKPILDDNEKEYLIGVIKPFRNQVFNICKHNITCYEYMYEQINIKVKDGIDNGYTTISLPIFKKDTMYKGMEGGKEYSLEELGL